jgi:integrase
MVWSDEAETKFRAIASPQMTLAFLLALWTGQRQGDLLRLTWAAYDGEFIRLTQSKTGRAVTIFVGAPLKAILDATRRVSAFIIATDDNRPFTSDGFRASWRKTCQRAGISGLTFHDLRGTAVTRLAAVGCTEMEIAAITGHAVSDVRSILDRHYYSRDPSIGIRAIRKLEKGTNSANRPANQTSPNGPEDG